MVSRRDVLAVSGTTTIAATAGCSDLLFFLDDGPEDVAEEFVEALNDGDFQAANDLIHPDARIDGAGFAADVLAGYYGIDAVVEAAEMSVEDTNTREESDGQALVAVTVSVDIGFDETEGDVGVELREHDGDWMVWDMIG